MPLPADTPPARTARARLSALAPLLVAGLLPCAMVFVANRTFVLNHFYARAPYLLDSGWLSALAHRSGPFLLNPPIACDYAKRFYGVHASPLLSMFSLVSEIVPLARIEWFALFEAAVYAPLGLVFHVAAPLDRAPRSLPALVLAALAALAFAFSGQAMMCIFLPHFEPAIAGFLCLLLGAIVSGRRALIWPLFVLCVSVREDAGLHTALALSPLLFLHWRGVTLLVSRRLLVTLMLAAAGGSVFLVLVQKTFFPAPGLLRTEYLGDPAFVHLTGAALKERLTWLVLGCPFISVPLVASALVAAARRDGRYLLGWAATLPWMLVNLLAHQEAKWRFVAYTGFPFLVAFFWVYLYGAYLAPAARRLSHSALYAFVLVACVASTVTLRVRHAWVVDSVVHGVLPLEDARATEVRAFARAVGQRGSSLGKLAVDQSVAAVAIESLALDESYVPGMVADTIAFHRDNEALDVRVLLDLDALAITRCAHALKTGFYLCSRASDARAVTSRFDAEQVSPLLAFADVFSDARSFATRSLRIHDEGTYEVALSGAEASSEVLLDGSLVAQSAGPSVTFHATPGQSFVWRVQLRGVALGPTSAARLHKLD